MELGREDDEFLRQCFGSVGSSFYTHFMVLTLEGFPPIIEAAGNVHWGWYFYFAAFILFSNVVLMNLVTGIVCESVVNNAKDMEAENTVYEEESKKFKEVLLDILTYYDLTPDKEIDKVMFACLFRDKGVREALNTLDICLEIEDSQLFDILDEDGSGTLSFDEFFSSLLRLRGSKETLHSLLVQADLIRGGQEIKRHVDEAEEGIAEYAKAISGALQTKMSQRIGKLREREHIRILQTLGRPAAHHAAAQRVKQFMPESTHSAALLDDEGVQEESSENNGSVEQSTAPAHDTSAASVHEDSSALPVSEPSAAASREGSKTAAEEHGTELGADAAIETLQADVDQVQLKRCGGDLDEAAPQTEQTATQAYNSPVESVLIDDGSQRAEIAQAAAERTEQPYNSDSMQVPDGETLTPNPESSYVDAAEEPGAPSGERSLERQAADQDHGDMPAKTKKASTPPGSAHNSNREANSAQLECDANSAQPGATDPAEKQLTAKGATSDAPVMVDSGRLQGLLELVEASSAQARGALDRLSSDLGTSRSRVQDLEARLAAVRMRNAVPKKEECAAEISLSDECEEDKALAASLKRAGIHAPPLPAVRLASVREFNFNHAARPTSPTPPPPPPPCADMADTFQSNSLSRHIPEQPHLSQDSRTSAVAAPAQEASVKPVVEIKITPPPAAAAPAPVASPAPTSPSPTSPAAMRAPTPTSAEQLSPAGSQEQGSPGRAQSSRMVQRRRLEAKFAAFGAETPEGKLASPTSPYKSRNQLLSAFHSHGPDAQSLAKAAIYESEDSEQGR